MEANELTKYVIGGFVILATACITNLFSYLRLRVTTFAGNEELKRRIDALEHETKECREEREEYRRQLQDQNELLSESMDSDPDKYGAIAAEAQRVAATNGHKLELRHFGIVLRARRINKAKAKNA